ncbi:hypothetical protein [Scopulibacillus cellulosilyticus]|uniref:Yip1-like protein n=1 Tax=Scopulibacillus cellulosilyticus TaxID=2665665 RepID=A0ABW2PSE3_9BACL
MNHSVKLFKGIFRPDEEFRDFQETNKMRGLIWRWIVISILSGIVGTITIFITLDQMIPVNEILLSNKAVYLLGMFYFFIIFILWAVIPVITNLIISLVCWPFFLDIGFKQIFTINSYAALINLIGGFLNLSIIANLHTYQLLSPFGFGIIGKQFTNNQYIIAAMNAVTIFVIWGLVVQIKALFRASQKRKRYIIGVMIIVNIIYILLSFLAGAAMLAS